ncbi:MAG: hypothetical protein AAB451_00565 [Patescibacteria group bacterium]
MRVDISIWRKNPDFPFGGTVELESNCKLMPLSLENKAGETLEIKCQRFDKDFQCIIPMGKKVFSFYFNWLMKGNRRQFDENDETKKGLLDKIENPWRIAVTMI